MGGVAAALLYFVLKRLYQARRNNMKRVLILSAALCLLAAGLFCRGLQ